MQKAIDLMLSTARPDGGCLCDLHEKPNKWPPKSCVRGSVKALLAFFEMPEYWDHIRCRQLIDYFLNRHGIFKSRDHTRLVNEDMKRNSFPLTWRTNAGEILCALGRMGYGRDERLNDAWNVMESRCDAQGRYTLDMTPAQSPWKVGKPGEHNTWVSFYCLLAAKYAGRGHDIRYVGDIVT